jgi:hypothetical protein
MIHACQIFEIGVGQATAGLQAQVLDGSIGWPTCKDLFDFVCKLAVTQVDAVKMRQMIDYAVVEQKAYGVTLTLFVRTQVDQITRQVNRFQVYEQVDLRHEFIQIVLFDRIVLQTQTFDGLL